MKSRVLPGGSNGMATNKKDHPFGRSFLLSEDLEAFAKPSESEKLSQSVVYFTTSNQFLRVVPSGSVSR